MLFVLRHGERGDLAGDDEKKKVEKPVDPHLTELGKIQSFKAGEQLLSMLDADIENKRRYLLISSPFRRCIETIFHVSRALPENSVLGNKIYLNDFISEHQDPIFFNRNVLNELVYRTTPDDVAKHVKMEIQDGYPGPGEHFSEPIYPEGTKIYDRIAQGYEKLREMYLSDINKDNNVVMILVTHGHVGESFLRLYESPDYAIWIDYACVTQLTVEKGDKLGKVIVPQCHVHLEKAAEEYKKSLQ